MAEKKKAETHEAPQEQVQHTKGFPEPPVDTGVEYNSGPTAPTDPAPASLRPTPTNEEIVAAAYYDPRPSKDVGHPPSDPPPTPGWAEQKIKARQELLRAEEEKQKALEAEKRGSYKTRDVKAKD